MSWYDVYDNVEIQLITRRQAAAVMVIAAIVLASSLLLLALGIAGRFPLALSLLTAAAAGGGFSWWLVRRIRRLRRIVWCVKLSREEVVGYDYARRRRSISWRQVERIDLGDGSLTIVGPHPLSLEITHHFREFAQVSHRIIYYADHFGIPVFVNGKPWQHLDVYDVFPFLADDTSSPRRGSAAV